MLRRVRKRFKVVDENPADGPIGAHDQMWFLARDLVLGENAHPIPAIPERSGRPGGEGRELPQVPMPHEMLIKQLMNILMIEIRAERSFAFNVALFRDPEVFQDRRELMRTVWRMRTFCPGFSERRSAASSRTSGARKGAKSRSSGSPSGTRTPSSSTTSPTSPRRGCSTATPTWWRRSGRSGATIDP